MRLSTEQHDTLAAAIVKDAGPRAWATTTSLGRATLVLDHFGAIKCAEVAAYVTPAQLSIAMNCMPLNAQGIGNYADVTCALASVLRAMPKPQPASTPADLPRLTDAERDSLTDEYSVLPAAMDDEQVAKRDAACSARHSPGPWTVHTAHDEFQSILDSRGRCLADIAYHSQIDSHYPLRAESEANAVVFAAAAEMLEALTELAEPAYPDGACHKGICSEAKCAKCGRHARARAAIAKATGAA